MMLSLPTEGPDDLWNAEKFAPISQGLGFTSLLVGWCKETS